MIQISTLRSGRSRFAAALLAALIVLAAFVFPAAVQVSAEESAQEDTYAEPEISSGNSIVIYNIETHSVLFEREAHERLAPTVVSKLMSAMIIADRYSDFSKKVTIAAEALSNIGAQGDISAPRLGLTAGSEMSVEDLLRATLVSAANDACNALAYDCSGGDMASFVEEMNRRAKELGATDTNFTDPSGVASSASYTTAADAALIASAFYGYNRLLEISSLPYYQLGNTMHTKNYLLSESLMKGYKLSGVKGMIAGQARQDGGYCLITSAEADGLTYIFVVMDAAGENRYPDGTRDFPQENAYADVHKLYPWATTAFGYAQLLSEGELLAQIPVTLSAEIDYMSVVPARSVEVLLPKGTDITAAERRIELTVSELEAPVQQGTVVGTVTVILDGREIDKVDLVTRFSAEKSELLSVFSGVKDFLFGDTMKTIIKVIIVLVVLFVVYELAFFIYRLVKKAGKKNGGE